MSVQFCFKVNIPKKVDFNVNELKKFVEKLYIGNKEPKFSASEVPFVLIYDNRENNVCILMTSRAKKNIERITSINESLKASNLKWIKDIYLGKPFLYEELQVQSELKPKKKGANLWESLKQRGPFFTHLEIPYKPLGASLIYDGKSYKLTPQEEKVAGFYARRLISEMAGGIVAAQLWATVPSGKPYRQNFWKDFKTYLTKENSKIFKDFDKIVWNDLITKIEDTKKDGLTVEERIEKKIRDEERKREYGFAILDGKREGVGNYIVEPAGIFEGRGANPNRGRVKREIIPEDVTLNLGENDPVPPAPRGHNWGGIEHDHKAEWLVRYRDSINNDVKYVRFDAKGKFKGESDLLKYATARKLQLHLQTVRDKYTTDTASKNITKKQLGTVLYLIDHYGIRVGGEKGEDDVDTVGATTLRVEHLKLKSPNHVIFDFLGKDSIRFYKDLTVPPLIYKNIEEFVKGKKGGTQVFDLISSRSVNIYLHEFDRHFTAKVFRTRLASNIMFEALKNVKIPKDSTKIRIKSLFNEANANVAEILNHTKNVSKKAEESVKKEKDKLDQLKKELSSKKGKEKETLLKKISDTENKIKAKTDVLTVAIGTSLQNYIDPRMIVAWSLQQKCDLSAIYPATLMKKFKWAIETTNPDWNWLTSPLAEGINPELEPSEVEDAGLAASEDDSPPKPRPRPKPKSPKRKPYIAPESPSPKPKPYIAPESSSDESSPSPKPKPYIAPEYEADFNTVLEICKNPTRTNITRLKDVHKDVIKWVYPFSKLALEKNINPKINNIFVKWYERINN